MQEVLRYEQFWSRSTQTNFLHNVREGSESRQEHRITLGSSIADCEAVPRKGGDLLSPYKTNILWAYKLCWHFFHKVCRARECRTHSVISLEAQHMPPKPSPSSTFPLLFFSPGRNCDKWQNSNVDLILPNVPDSEHIRWSSCLSVPVFFLSGSQGFPLPDGIWI